MERGREVTKEGEREREREREGYKEKKENEGFKRDPHIERDEGSEEGRERERGAR